MRQQPRAPARASYARVDAEDDERAVGIGLFARVPLARDAEHRLCARTVRNEDHAPVGVAERHAQRLVHGLPHIPDAHGPRVECERRRPREVAGEQTGGADRLWARVA
jgi:hypothetical protein